jgi:hypothetical protein
MNNYVDRRPRQGQPYDFRMSGETFGIEFDERSLEFSAVPRVQFCGVEARLRRRHSS